MESMRHRLAAGLLSLSFAGSVPAGDADLLELMRVLKDNGTITEAQFQRLAGAMEKHPQPKTEPQPQRRQYSAAAVEEVDTLVILDQGGAEVSSYDGQFSFRLGGRIMLDGAWYQEDQVKLGDGTELRRARIEAEGVMFGDWGYELGVEFSNGAEVKDAYVAYLGWLEKTLKIGQYKEPFSLEELTSSKYTTFMERALPNAFVPGRHIGLGASAYGDGWTAAAGLFGDAFDSDPADEGDEGWGSAARLSYAAIGSETRLLHLGAALAYRATDHERELRIRSRPESHVTDVYYVNTGKIKDVSDTWSYGIEAASVWGPWSLQGEYIATRIERTSGFEDYDLAGWYFYGSWFITGESRHYKPKSGRFGRILPSRDSGAWELGLRYSTIDLSDADLSGGSARHWTLGLNWYLNTNVRFMANYIRVDNDEAADDDGDVAGGDSPDILQVRVQAHF